MRLLDDRGDVYALGLATDQRPCTARGAGCGAVRAAGRAVADRAGGPGHRPAVRVGQPGAGADQRHPRRGAPRPDMPRGPAFLDVDAIESAARQVLDTGVPLVDQSTIGRTPADPDKEHAWSVSYYRLEDPGGRCSAWPSRWWTSPSGTAAAIEAARPPGAPGADRRRLRPYRHHPGRWTRPPGSWPTSPCRSWPTSPPSTCSSRSWTGRRATRPHGSPAHFRALAVKAGVPHRGGPRRRPARPGRPIRRRPPRHPVRAHRPPASCVSHVKDADLPHIARDPEAAGLLGRAGVHSYLAVPLIARGEVLGALGLQRDPQPAALQRGRPRAGRGSWPPAPPSASTTPAGTRTPRNTALTLQRSLLPSHPRLTPGCRSPPATSPPGAAGEVGGDWFDVIPLDGDKTALVVGDVMGSGINAAATMGRLRTATRALAELDLDPAQVLEHLDQITGRPGAVHRHLRLRRLRPAPRSAGSPTPATCRRSCVRAGRGPRTARPAHRRTARRRRRRLRDHHVRPRSRRPTRPLHRWAGRNPPAAIDERLDALLRPARPTPRARWRRPATCSWAPCATPTTPTTWPCSSPEPPP